ncbi:hypothetical protein DPEC_G00232890 [Dallia pectoralis]|uniref:Uncharacterized protein n=1 Tax=Dallia pectoralis TaxID=75939 RepID=A0ACC2FXL5_DALPE|nr:hypothetical protein DPEC_G00232890 [Dallia pectoralis]
MEDRTLVPAGRAGDPKAPLTPIVVKTEPDTKTHRLKEEDVSDVPVKVPRFQYVDFPSLHRCIQQLTVPPLDSWLEGCPLTLGRPSGGHGPITSKERVPKFKYVDYPSLHHCIQQLSVPPLESWRSGLARPGNGVMGGPGSIVALPGVARENSIGHGDGSASAQMPDQYTAFPFPGTDPGSMQSRISSKQMPSKQQQFEPNLSSTPCAKPNVRSPREESRSEVVRSDQRSQKVAGPKIPRKVIRRPKWNSVTVLTLGKGFGEQSQSLSAPSAKRCFQTQKNCGSTRKVTEKKSHIEVLARRNLQQTKMNVFEAVRQLQFVTRARTG